MIEEPYRWVEAIANRREYIESQLAAGSPIVGLSFREGVLLLTLSRERQKLFEIYDRIGLGVIGHPGDIERLRMAAIEVTSAEGFARSACDVSLRRLANYSLSPALKAAFEQVYGAPYLARLLFAEMGRAGQPNLFLRLDYDGSIRTNGGDFGRAFEEFGVIAGTAHATLQMERFLSGRPLTHQPLERALSIALDAWCVGHLALAEENAEALPDPARLAAHRSEQLRSAAVEAAVLEQGAPVPATWRALHGADLRPALEAR